MQAAPAPFSQMENITTLFRNVFLRRAAQAMISSGAEEIQTYFKNLFAQSRLYLIRDRAMVEEEWAKIRRVPALVDLMLMTTIEFQLDMRLAAVDDNDFSRHLALAYGLRNPASRDTEKWVAMDTDLYERLPSDVDLTALIHHNPWLVTLYMIERLGPAILVNFVKPAEGR